MGQGSQTGLEGQHPAWGQMAQMGGAPLPDPMDRAGDQFRHARNQFGDARDIFQALQRGPEKREARPDFNADRDQFRATRDWYRELQDMPGDMATGYASFGPPRLSTGPELAPMMEVPQFAGTPKHDGTVQGLLSILQKQTANQTFGGGNRGGVGGGGGRQHVQARGTWGHRQDEGFDPLLDLTRDQRLGFFERGR